MKILILGAGGMLGHSLFKELSKRHQVWGTVRNNAWSANLFQDCDVNNLDKIESLISNLKPDFVINCIGIIKQLKASSDKIASLEINSLWPHRLAELCDKNKSRMIHFSTDCVFAGSKGNYEESDLADARDTYGLSKFMGEVDYPHTLTLRTSIIGHELNSNVSLIDWFLSQKKECKGYTKAIYSGFPTVVVAQFLNDYIFKKFISGVYHFSSDPINKYDLLKLVATEYKKDIQIIPSEDVIIDRSLNSDRLRKELNFKPLPWPDMIKLMHTQYTELGLYKNKEIH